MIGRPSGLGRGLGALIPPRPTPQPTPTPSSDFSASVVTSNPVAPTVDSVAQTPVPVQTEGHGIAQIPVEMIERNPHQPRVHFDHTHLEDLISSIKEHGVIQPLVVTKLPNGRYELIAGERRLRASTIAGLKTVPAVIRTATEQQKLELAIIENVQRQDLNPIEEAKAYMRLMDEFHLTQDEVSRKVGKSRPQVGNTVRLLQLPVNIQEALMQGKISASNARTLLSLPTEEEKQNLFQAMLAGNFTVRQTEARVYQPRRSTMQDPNVAAMEDQVRNALHCKVQIKRSPQGAGEIRLAFTNDEELSALTRKLKGE